MPHQQREKKALVEVDLVQSCREKKWGKARHNKLRIWVRKTMRNGNMRSEGMCGGGGGALQCRIGRTRPRMLFMSVSEVDLVQSCREENTQKINIKRASWCQHELQTSQITTKNCGCLGRKKVGKSEARGD